MQTLLLIIFIVAIVCFCLWDKNRAKKKQQTKSQQPMHFDMLDENGNPIRKPIVEVTVGGGSDAPIQELQYFCIKDKGYHTSVWPKGNGYRGLDYIEFNIAGISHQENIDQYLGEFVATLEPEPTNPYDENAIKILAPDGHQVGYVPRDTTDAIRDITHLPCSCFCYIGENDGTYFSDCYITIN
jgi:hypothetical protein